MVKSKKKNHPWNRIGQKIGLLSEDRQGEGLALSLSIKDNITLSHFKPFSLYGFMNLSKQKTMADNYCRHLRLKTKDSNEYVYTLSGGNQQKVAMARLLHQDAQILLLDEPTRGIDVVSKSQIYKWIGNLAFKGKTIVFVSSYLPELLGICNRIAVFFRGSIVDIRDVKDWNIETLTGVVTTGRKNHNH